MTRQHKKRRVVRPRVALCFTKRVHIPPKHPKRSRPGSTWQIRYISSTQVRHYKATKQARRDPPHAPAFLSTGQKSATPRAVHRLSTLRPALYRIAIRNNRDKRSEFYIERQVRHEHKRLANVRRIGLQLGAATHRNKGGGRLYNRTATVIIGSDPTRSV